MTFNSDKIMEVLPHRQPFLLIDKILELEEGKSCTGLKNISITDPIFQGHFPDQHIYPGVLLIESMAQVGAFVILLDEKNKGKKAYFTKIKNARFLKPVLPGDTVIIKTKLISQKLNIGFAEAEAIVNGVLVAKAEISFAIN